MSKEIEIETLIPNFNENWKVKHDMIYFHKYADILLLRKYEDDYFISLDRRVRNQVLSLISHLHNNDIDFFLSTRIDFHKDPTARKSLIIQNYLNALCDDIFFDNIFDIGFDYVGNLTKFMTKFDCHDMFKEPFEKIKKYYLKENTDWYTNRKYYILEREDMRDFIRTLEREIKLSLLL